MSESPHTLPPLHGGQLRLIAARYGISSEKLLDFSANINPDGPSSSVKPAIQRALEDPTSLVNYPDLELTELKQFIAGSVGVEPEAVTIANGFVPLLDAALRALSIKKCLLPVPSFNEYRRTLENAFTLVIPYSLSSAEGFSYKPDAILEALLNNGCDAILLANPQNPSGALCESDRMLRFFEMTRDQGITVLLDEAFIDYCPAHSLCQQAPEQSNLIVFR
jgi:threonine-phosphate decarboxylase